MEREPSAELLERWRAGDPEAAHELFGRYTVRLIALARRRLSAKLARRLDPEDVVQSAYRSFCAGARANDFVLRRSGDLWRLLAAITLHKLQHQVQRHQAGKRSVDRERAFEGENGLGAAIATREPTPEEAAELAEEVEFLMRRMKPLDRRMFELRLQGYRIEEIAAETERSERWVRRVLGRVKGWLDQRERAFSGA